MGGRGPSTSNPDVTPNRGERLVPVTPSGGLTNAESASSDDSPSQPPPDDEDEEEASGSGSPILEPIVQTGVGAAARGLGGVGGLGKTNSEQEEEGAAASASSGENPSRDPVVQTAIGAAALGLGGVGGLGKTNSEPETPPGDAQGGFRAGRPLPMGKIPATPAQVGRALKVIVKP